jgi:beta-lactamase regulating signal transducer with metallopeptidase domain
MATFFEYVLKLSLCYGVIYLFYFVLLKRLTHYSVNRFFLLTASLLAFFIPLFRADVFVAPQTITASSFINSIPTINTITAGSVFIPGENTGNITYMLFGLFVAGVIICMLHFFIQFLSFKKIRESAALIHANDGIKMYHLDMDIIPFTFGNSIYINKLKHSAGELKEIIRHESVHAYQKHTVDVLVAEFVCMLNWYNPFAWLIKHTIKQNLEFLADDTVLTGGTDKKNYQYLLLKVMGNAPLTITSNLNFSSLKKRIYMMNKTKTSRTHLLKFLFVLPVIALLMLAFRDTNSTVPKANDENIGAGEETYKLSELTYSIPDPQVAEIVKKEQSKSLLQAGKPFTIKLIKNERDRLRSLLEKNGYNNINSHAISFLIDSTLSNNNFSVQININLQTKAATINKNNNGQHKSNTITGDDNKYHPVASWNNGIANTAGFNMTGQQTGAGNLNTGNISIN